MDILKAVGDAIIAIVYVILAYHLFFALGSAFGVVSAIIFVIKAGYHLINGDALYEPRIIILLFGLSFLGGVVGIIFFNHLLPALVEGKLLEVSIIIVIILMVYFGGKDKLMEAWRDRDM